MRSALKTGFVFWTDVGKKKKRKKPSDDVSGLWQTPETFVWAFMKVYKQQWDVSILHLFFNTLLDLTVDASYQTMTRGCWMTQIGQAITAGSQTRQIEAGWMLTSFQDHIQVRQIKLTSPLILRVFIRYYETWELNSGTLKSPKAFKFNITAREVPTKPRGGGGVYSISPAVSLFFIALVSLPCSGLKWIWQTELNVQIWKSFPTASMKKKKPTLWDSLV